MSSSSTSHHSDSSDITSSDITSSDITSSDITSSDSPAQEGTHAAPPPSPEQPGGPPSKRIKMSKDHDSGVSSGGSSSSRSSGENNNKSGSDGSNSIGKEESSEGVAKRKEALTRREQDLLWKNSDTDKRECVGSGNGDNSGDGGRAGPKRKVAVFIGYNGSQYDGLQANPGMHTVSKVLSEAMIRVGCISQDNAQSLAKVKWMHASRTDKRVHALVNVVSLNMVMVSEEMLEIAELINAELPQDVRVLGISRVVKSFHPQRMCEGRLYEYILPTYAFHHTGRIEQTLQSVEESAPRGYRISKEEIERIDKLLAHYCGTKSFHNYTKRESYVPAALTRHIKTFQCGEPFMLHGVECIVLTVHGQSFMIHQIRKMIGAVISVMRGMLNEQEFVQSFEQGKNVRVPRAPGDGLLLADMFFTNFNKRHAKTHGPISMEKFRDSQDHMRQQLYDFIMRTETEEALMAQWLHEEMVSYLNSTHPTYDKAKNDDEQQQQDEEKEVLVSKKDGAACANGEAKKEE